MKWVLIASLSVLSCFAMAAEPQVFCQQKWKEMEVEGMKIRLYRLRAESFPSGKVYTLIVRNVDGSTTETFSYVANPKGHLILNEPEDVKQAAPYIVTPLRQGEMVAYGMQAQEGEEDYLFELIPFPNEVSKGKRHLSVKLKDVDGTAFVCCGKGFKPAEAFTVTCSIEKEELSYPVVVDAQGTFEVPMSLTSSEIHSGEAHLQVVSAQGPLSLSFPWGVRASEFVGASCLEVK